jgi:hypothetical protein
MAEERIALSMKERERLKVFTRSRKDIYGRSMPPAVCGLIRSKIFEQIWCCQWKNTLAVTRPIETCTGCLTSPCGSDEAGLNDAGHERHRRSSRSKRNLLAHP